MKDNKIEDKILNAAFQVVSNNTISGTRMHLIAEKAEIPKSNLHYYFKTKQNLMLALHKKVVSHFMEVRKEIRPTCNDVLSEQLQVFFQQKLDCILKEPEYDFVEIDFWLQANINSEYKEIMCAAFRVWRQEIADILEKYVDDLSPENKTHIPNVIISLLEGATMQYHLDKEHFNLESYMKFCNTMIQKTIECK